MIVVIISAWLAVAACVCFQTANTTQNWWFSTSASILWCGVTWNLWEAFHCLKYKIVRLSVDHANSLKGLVPCVNRSKTEFLYTVLVFCCLLVMNLLIWVKWSFFISFFEWVSWLKFKLSYRIKSYIIIN